MENRLAEISDKQLIKEIYSGKRSMVFDPLTKVEIEELIKLIKKEGGIAILDGDEFITNRQDLHDKYIKEYVVRKLSIEL